MTVATPTMTPREALADSLHDALLEHAITARPDMDGQEVVTIEVVNQVFQRKNWPPVTDQAADVRTPAKVVVTAVCPACHQTAAITTTIEPELRVEASSSTLRLHAKAKPGSHTCGQVSAELGNGQTSAFDLDELTDDEGVVNAEVLHALLIAVGEQVTVAIVESWTEPDREVVRAWATAIYELNAGTEGVEVPPRPRPLFEADTNDGDDVVDEETGDGPVSEEPKGE